MLALILFLACLFSALAAGFMASVSDLRGLIIPNIYSVIVGASFFAAYTVLWLTGNHHVLGGFYSHLIAAFVIFAITAAMFATNVLGAADSKLATVYALWVGLRGLIPFLFYMSLCGGLLGLAALVAQRWKPFAAPKEGSWIARVQGGESKVPYGIAIVFGALVSFVKLGYVDPQALSSFLSR